MRINQTKSKIFVILNFTKRTGMTERLCSHLSGMTKNSGLLRFARNDEKFLVPQCHRNLMPSSPLSLPSPLSCFARIKRIRAARLHPLLACAGARDIRLCHSGSLEKYYEFTNSYFSCYSESINAN